jgi:hypothetical protein
MTLAMLEWPTTMDGAEHDSDRAEKQCAWPWERETMRDLGKRFCAMAHIAELASGPAHAGAAVRDRRAYSRVTVFGCAIAKEGPA